MKGSFKIHYRPDEANARRLMCLRIIEGGCSGAKEVASVLSWSLDKAKLYVEWLKKKGYIKKDRENNIFVMTETGKEFFKELKKA